MDVFERFLRGTSVANTELKLMNPSETEVMLWCVGCVCIVSESIYISKVFPFAKVFFFPSCLV